MAPQDVWQSRSLLTSLSPPIVLLSQPTLRTYHMTPLRHNISLAKQIISENCCMGFLCGQLPAQLLQNGKKTALS